MGDEEDIKKKRKRSKKKEKKSQKKKEGDYDDADDRATPLKTLNDVDDTTGEALVVQPEAETGEQEDRDTSDPTEEKTQQEDEDDDNEDGDKPKRKRKRKRKKTSSGQEEEDAPPSTEEEKKLISLEHTVYVEGIPFDATEEQVKEWFENQGCNDILQMRLSRWQDTGRLRGYGHVVFGSVTSQQTAIKDLNGKHMGKRYLSIQAPQQPRASTTMGSATGTTPREQPTGCNVVFVKNLPYHATEDDILTSFQVCGKIVTGGVRIARNFQSRQSKGFAYVEFKNPEGAHGAVQKASKPFGLKVLDRPVFVDYDEGRVKGSYKTEDGRLWAKEYGKK